MFIVYGANGYTGELVARLAASQGLKPVLAGRRADAVARLAHELGLEHRVFALDEPKAIDAGLSGATCVLHCAGPFSRTSKPMADACLRTGVHYLDVTGELGVFEALAARDAEAKSKGVMLLPGVGYDVVPSDCLAAHLKSRLPSATHLALAMRPLGRTSHGTATTMLEHLHEGSAVRENGRIVNVPVAHRTRGIDYGRGAIASVTIPWGDVSTAYYSTGIPNIEVYLAAPAAMRLGMKATRVLAPLLGAGVVKRVAQKLIDRAGPGPTAEERAAGRSLLWGEVRDGAGNVRVSRLSGPEGYTLTAEAALACVRRVLAGEAPSGFQTPSRAFGADFVLTLPGVERLDVV